MLTKLPLHNIRILITRSAHQAESFASRLKHLGAITFELPVIAIGPPDTWEPLDSALRNILSYNWLLFASVNAVEACLSRLAAAGKSIDDLRQIKIAAIGSSTAANLEKHGLKPSFCPSQFIGEGLIKDFPGYPKLQSLRILWPRTNVGRTYVIDKLQDAGAQVDVVQSYKTSAPAEQDAIAHKLFMLLKEHQLDVITLASSQSAKNFAILLGKELTKQGIEESAQTEYIAYLLKGVKLASIGPETSHTTRTFLGRIDIEAKEYTLDGLVKAILAEIPKSDPLFDSNPG